MKKFIFLIILFAGVLSAQTIKVTALPAATKIDRGDLFLLTQPATSTPVSKKMTFQTMLDSAQVIIKDYTINLPPINTSMLNSTSVLSLPLFHDARVAWQDSINSAFEKIDDKTIFFDPNDFTLDTNNVLQLNDILAIDTLIRVNTILSKDDTSLVTGKGIADYVKKSVDSLNTLNKMTNVAYKGQANNFGAFTQTATAFNSTSAIQLNGTSINTTGTLTNVAYKGQNNNFGAFTQTSDIFTASIQINAPYLTRTTEGKGIRFNDVFGSHIASGATAAYPLDIFHNAILGRDSSDAATYKWTASHASFGSRGIRLDYGGAGKGIIFYADAVATTADASFTPTQRMIIQNDGKVGIGMNPTEKLDVTGNIKASGTITGTVITGTDHIAGSADYFYFGAEGTDGSWRIGRSGNNLVFERRESGSWVTKSTITP